MKEDHQSRKWPMSGPPMEAKGLQDIVLRKATHAWEAMQAEIKEQREVAQDRVRQLVLEQLHPGGIPSDVTGPDMEVVRTIEQDHDHHMRDFIVQVKDDSLGSPVFRVRMEGSPARSRMVWVAATCPVCGVIHWKGEAYRWPQYVLAGVKCSLCEHTHIQDYVKANFSQPGRDIDAEEAVRRGLV